MNKTTLLVGICIGLVGIGLIATILYGFDWLGALGIWLAVIGAWIMNRGRRGLSLFDRS